MSTDTKPGVRRARRQIEVLTLSLIVIIVGCYLFFLIDWKDDAPEGKVVNTGYTPPCGEAETELISHAWKKFTTPRPGCRLSFYMATGGGLGEIRINGDPSTTDELVWGEDAPNYKGKNLRFIEVRLVNGRPFEFTVAQHPAP